MSKKKKRRYKAKDNKPNQKINKVPSPRTAFDTFSNMMTQTGDDTLNPLNTTEYPISRLTQDYNLMNSLYRNHWIVRKIIDTIPEDMIKNWIEIQSALTPDQLKKIDKMEKKVHLHEKLIEGLKLGRLYGGAGAVMIIEGHEHILDEPLDLNLIMPGAFKGLIVSDRWIGLQPSTEIIEDVSSPDFGMPMYYDWDAGANGESVRVHHSRVLRFTGRELPWIERQVEMNWGASEVEIIFDELRKRDNSSFNIANLLFSANLKVMAMDDLGQLLSMGDEESVKQLYTTIALQNRIMNSNGMLIMDREDTFNTHQYTFSGISDVYETFMYDISGAAEIPATRLFGRSPAGMNATGECDLKDYYDLIGRKQDSKLRPLLDKLLPVEFMSELGYIPDDYDYIFNPISTQSEEELGNILDKKFNAIDTAYGDGLLTQKMALKELKQLSDSTGVFSNITDEDIEKASNEYETGEMDFGGGLADEYMENEQETGEEVSSIDSQSNEQPIKKDSWIKRFIKYVRGY